ncbi:MAG TPA: hypothetical protein VN515_03480, partial [Terriglobales bacterium]|nr:hypothetical protein [Terriglobales bacterium]
MTRWMCTQRLLDRKVAISMDGRGRALDNVFAERLWRTVKYENVFLIDWRGPQRGFAARPACARPGMGTPEPHAGAALAGAAPALLAGGGPP